jgi:hypothetical protein
MQVTSLRAFVDRVAEAQRLRFGDLRRLRRDVLPDGLQSRDDVEALERADGGWPEYLLEAVKGFVISASDPQGLVDPELTHWLVSVLSDAQPKTAVRIARCGVASRGGGRCPARVRQGERQANGKAKAVTATARKIACSSTTPSVTAWTTPTPAPLTTRSATGIGCAPAPSHSRPVPAGASTVHAIADARVRDPPRPGD